LDAWFVGNNNNYYFWEEGSTNQPTDWRH